MINKIFEILKKDLSDYLSRLPELDVTNAEFISLSPVVRPNGELAIPNDSLGLTLVNVEEERVMKSQKSAFTDTGGRVSHVNPEIKLNLYMLITANFGTYETGLKFLSGAIRFFQGKFVFTPQNTPALDPSITKLIAELQSFNFEQQNHLWGSLGAKYLPSVIYKIRLLAIQESRKADDQLPIKVVDFAGLGI